jgi:hypothetical protein
MKKLSQFPDDEDDKRANEDINHLFSLSNATDAMRRLKTAHFAETIINRSY